MKNIPVIIIAFLLVFSTPSQAQLTITTQTAAQAMSVVQNDFFGPGVGSVSNVTLNAGPNGFATFTGTSNLGFADGIILSTGSAANIAAAAGTQNDVDHNVQGDANLQTLTANTIMDVGVLEFDFAPATDTLRFSYVFGSEEYPEYACSAFNDVFGFFISGSNPAGGSYTNYNAATIPGTSLPVSISSVNPGVPGAAAGGGTCTLPNQSLAYSAYYVNNMGTTVIFDGFTTVLSITIPVVVCDNYHIKLAVGDASDGVFDSGVFLKSNTFGGLPPRIHSQNATGVVATFDTTTLCIGATAQLTAAKSVSYSWTNGDTTQTTTVSQAGQENFYVLNPSNGCFAVSAPRIVAIDANCAVVLNELSAADLVDIAPNPFSANVTIKFREIPETETVITVNSITGETVKHLVLPSFSDRATLSLAELAKGIYLVNITNAKGSVVKKITRE